MDFRKLKDAVGQAAVVARVERKASELWKSVKD